MKPVQARELESRATPTLDLATTTQSNRRSLLQRGFTFGIAAPFVIPGSRALARQNSHSSDETGTPEPSEENDHTPANNEHVEAPVPAEPIRPFALYDPVLQPVEAGAKDITVVARDATLLIAKDVPFAGWTYDGTIPGRPFRVVEGDTVNVTFRIDSTANAHHSLDFHSARPRPMSTSARSMPVKSSPGISSPSIRAPTCTTAGHRKSSCISERGCTVR